MTWIQVLTLPAYLIQGITDCGMVESWEVTPGNDAPNCIEKDDLRIAIELSAGVNILLNGQNRIILESNGDLRVEMLCNCAGNE